MSINRVQSLRSTYDSQKSKDEEASVSEKVSSIATKFGTIVDPTAPIPLRSPRKISRVQSEKTTPVKSSIDEQQHQSVQSLASRFTETSKNSPAPFSEAAAAFRAREEAMKRPEESRVVGMARSLDDGAKKEVQRVANVARAFESSAVAERLDSAVSPPLLSKTPQKSEPIREAPIKEARTTPVREGDDEQMRTRAFGRAKSVHDTARMFEKGVSNDVKPVENGVKEAEDAKLRFQDAAKRFEAS